MSHAHLRNIRWWVSAPKRGHIRLQFPRVYWRGKRYTVRFDRVLDVLKENETP